mmetsp:Transcript_69038/g.114371  ORF Transcript_69038/g.114371 Transcript_69038/m.114371 type:complete len:82 (+) Transcript_69038:210-455(+)
MTNLLAARRGAHRAGGATIAHHSAGLPLAAVPEAAMAEAQAAMPEEPEEPAAAQRRRGPRLPGAPAREDAAMAPSLTEQRP